MTREDSQGPKFGATAADHQGSGPDGGGTHAPPKTPAFEAGSLVKLKSGGPAMTVTGSTDRTVNVAFYDSKHGLSLLMIPAVALVKTAVAEDLVPGRRPTYRLLEPDAFGLGWPLSGLTEEDVRRKVSDTIRRYRDELGPRTGTPAAPDQVVSDHDRCEDLALLIKTHSTKFSESRNNGSNYVSLTTLSGGRPLLFCGGTRLQALELAWERVRVDQGLPQTRDGERHFANAVRCGELLDWLAARVFDVRERGDTDTPGVEVTVVMKSREPRTFRSETRLEALQRAVEYVRSLDVRTNSSATDDVRSGLFDAVRRVGDDPDVSTLSASRGPDGTWTVVAGAPA